MSWLNGIPSGDERAEGLRLFTADSLTDFEDQASSDSDAWRVGLPISDLSKKGRPFWILPNLSSLTNIYARINLFHQRSVGGVRLIHDEQMQYDNILHKGMQTSETLGEFGIAPSLSTADYAFTQHASLEFRCSAECVGIQVADVVAGFVMRHVHNRLDSGGSTSDDSEAYRSLMELADPDRGVGINLVLSHYDIARSGLGAIPTKIRL
jgi:hypothetical protein